MKMKQKAIQTVLLASSMLAYVMLPCISQAEVVQNTAQTTSSTVNTPQQTTIPPTGTITYFYNGSTLVNAEDDNGDMSTYLSRTVRTIVDVNTKTVLDTQGIFTDGKNAISQTDSTGTNVTSTQQYNAFGQPVNQNPNTNSQLSIATNPFQYDGYYNDSESGLDYLNARYYSPTLMQFISMDTYDLANRYGYCDGNPIGNDDPLGHSIVQTIASGLALAGMMVAAASSGQTEILAYMFSNLAYSGGQISTDAYNKNWSGVIGNILFFAAGIIGTSGAIPKAFAQLNDDHPFIQILGKFNNPENSTIDNLGTIEYATMQKGKTGPLSRMQTRMGWVQNRTKTPSTITGVLGGMGAGIANAPHTNNEGYNIGVGAAYAAVGAAAGFLSGKIYGIYNAKTPTENAPWQFVKNALIKSASSGIVAGASSALDQIINDKEDNASSSTLGISLAGDFASPIILAVASGLTQNYQQYGTGAAGVIGNYSRYAYLDAKTNYIGQLFSIGPMGLVNNLNPTNGII